MPQNKLTRALALILPCRCALCGALDRDVVCAPCADRYIGDAPTRCGQCALPVPAKTDVARCGACLRDAPRFDATVAAVEYAPPVDRLVLQLKFGGTLALAGFMASAIRARLADRKPDDMPSVLIPVPLGDGRLSARGFNQAMEIARPLARLCGVDAEPALLARTRDTLSQSLLPPDERRRNVRGAFTVFREHIGEVRDVHVGIVDDVMTTGETLNAIASALKSAGSARVTNLVFARTVLK